jgi:hypothetical protein
MNTFNMEMNQDQDTLIDRQYNHHYFTCLHREFGKSPKYDLEVHHLFLTHILVHKST